MTARPTTMWLTLKRRMGLDGNPLRRPSDVMAAWLMPLAVLVFVALIPAAATLTGSVVRAQNAALEHAVPTWHKVTGHLLRSAPGPAQTDHGANTWSEVVLARWTFDGHQHTGAVSVPAGSRAGSAQTVYLNNAGQVQTLPLDSAQLADRIDTITFIVMGVSALLLLILKGIARSLLDRRRIAAWESDWLAVGPRWSHHG